MALLLVFKSLTLLFESLRYFTFQSVGQDQSLFDVFHGIFLMLKGLLLFIVIVLLGTGWSFVKPFLQDNDRRLLMVVIPLQFIAGIARITIDEANSSSMLFWQQVLDIVQAICCILILLPIVWSVRQLKEAGSKDGKVAKNLARAKLFRNFYVAVIMYIYFTFIMELVEDSVSYQFTWVIPVLAQLGTMLFYVYTGYHFRPVEQNPYLVLDADDFNEGGEALDRELQDVAESRLQTGARAQGGTIAELQSKAKQHQAAVSQREDVDI